MRRKGEMGSGILPKELDLDHGPGLGLGPDLRLGGVKVW